MPPCQLYVDKVPYKRSQRTKHLLILTNLSILYTIYCQGYFTWLSSIIKILYFILFWIIIFFKSSNYIENYMMMTMDHTQEQTQLYQDSCKEQMKVFSRNLKDEKESYDSDESSSIGEASTNTNGSSISSSLDTADDASSSYSSNSTGSLYDLSDLMSQLPIKRGLSKFYQGKSQSFTSIARVGSIEELAKKESAYNRRKSMKGCKSYGGSLNNFKLHTLPKPIISKKNSRGLLSSSSFPNKKGSKFCQ